MIRQSIYGMDEVSLKEFFVAHKLPSPTLSELFRFLYPHGKSVHPRVPPKTMEILQRYFTFELPQIKVVQRSKDGTVKFLMELVDGLKVETVLIPFGSRYTVCLSSQVGCSMKCSFCFTGTQGLERHLTAAEIVGQYLQAWEWLLRHLPELAMKPKIVFMGQGEPLHNFEAVKRGLQILLFSQGVHLGARQITLSTVGLVPGLRRFSELYGINLALSLHSPFDEVRSQLIPLNRLYNLQSIFSVLNEIVVNLRKRQFINFEYLLIDSLNDGEREAKALVELLNQLKNRRAIVNLIPFNEFPGSVYKRPSRKRVERFQKILLQERLFASIRTTKGSDILAACGQLKVMETADLNEPQFLNA